MLPSLQRVGLTIFLDPLDLIQRCQRCHVGNRERAGNSRDVLKGALDLQASLLEEGEVCTSSDGDDNWHLSFLIRRLRLA